MNIKVCVIMYFLLLLFGINNVEAIVDEKDLAKDYPYSKYCGQHYTRIINDECFNSLDKALPEWQKYKRDCSQQGIYEHYLANIYLAFDDDEKAVEILRQSINNANFNIAENALGLGLIFHVQKKYSDLANIGQMLIEKYPNYWNGYFLLGLSYIDKEDVQSAKKYLEQAYSIHPGLAAVNAYLSTVYYEEKRYEDVVRLYQSAYKDMPESIILQQRPTATMILSLIHLNRFDEAKKFFKEWVENDPDVQNCKYYPLVKQEMQKLEVKK